MNPEKLITATTLPPSFGRVQNPIGGPRLSLQPSNLCGKKLELKERSGHCDCVGVVAVLNGGRVGRFAHGFRHLWEGLGNQLVSKNGPRN